MVYSCRPDVDSSYIDYKSTNTNLTNFFTLVRVARFRFTHPNPLGPVADISAQYIVPFCGFLRGSHVRQQNKANRLTAAVNKKTERSIEL